MNRQSFPIQIVTFLFSGGLAALANLTTGILLRRWLHGDAGYRWSIWLGFATGTAVSFVLNRRFTFAIRSKVQGKQIVRYVLTAVVGSLLATSLAQMQVYVLRWLAFSFLNESNIGSLAHLGAVGLTTVYNFLAIKYFALRPDEHATTLDRLRSRC